MSDIPPPPFPQPSSGGEPSNPYGSPAPLPPNPPANPPLGALPEPAGGNGYGAPPPPPPPNWGTAPAPPRFATPIAHPRGTLILVFGILSIVCCGIFTGIPAIVMGGSALKEIDSGATPYTNRGIVQAGRICGIVGTSLSVLLILANLALRSSTN